MSTHQLIQTVRDFLLALERFDGESAANLLHPAAQRIEFPNKLKPAGSTQTVAQMVADVPKAKTILASQRYDVLHLATADDLVVAELTWNGKLNADIGTLQAGDEMIAHCAAAFAFSDGKIVAIRNYDCFEDF